MRKITATIRKEIVLLMRDRAGLLMLFVMPAVLVFVVCLAQEKVLNPKVSVLVLDMDGQTIGDIISGGVGKSPFMDVEIKKDGIDPGAAKILVERGDYKFCIVIPKGCSEYLRNKGGAFFRGASQVPEKKEVRLYFDPSVQGGFRAAVVNALQRVISSVEHQIIIKQLLAMTGMDRAGNTQDPSLPWLELREIYAAGSGFIKMPTPIQQNVPAWALFGIFFTAVPLAGSLIKERESRMLDRLTVMPVSVLIPMAGKMIAYIMVCSVQFFMVFIIGKYLLPLAGTGVFEPGNQVSALVLVIFASTMAATGYGVMLGFMAGSYEQTAVFGSISIVIASVLGGVMVPVYLMPEPMQVISNISPVSWALEGFYDILLRGGDLISVIPEVSSLLLFSAITIIMAWLTAGFKKQG